MGAEKQVYWVHTVVAARGVAAVAGAMEVGHMVERQGTGSLVAVAAGKCAPVQLGPEAIPGVPPTVLLRS